MHWVDRGAEPAGLGALRQRYTPRWVAYYVGGVGTRPTDARWRDFRGNLSAAFSGLCGYCEEATDGQVDHFRPKSKFPKLVYAWPNWVFACPDCNITKSDQWPPGGYVDPCARTLPAHPEEFFTYDTVTGELLPQAGLTPRRRQKASQTITDLGLNDEHHLKKRLQVLGLLNEISGLLANRQREALERLRPFARRDQPLSSLVRAFLLGQGFSVK